ncbi:Calcitonin gene-related peptide type 1 receptor [Frankliniella fusca]|uniref:Calcitonin gene-related peptide type 1 receptor n=1 Tax=Frankliniella fusca TaxID=407009 RepID=A0AAE1H3V6_9NEOP|nr:Calcitonin gene-related peptide type 1 receptor [Frankliniella fusca]
MAEDQGEGKELQLFRVKLRKAVEDAVGLQNDELPSAIATIPNIKQKKLATFMKIFQQKVVQNFCEEAENLIRVEELDKLLKQREEIIQQQGNFQGTIAWRPSGSVAEDIRSHDMEILKSKSYQLSCMCEAKEKEVDALLVEVSKVRGRISDYQTQLCNNISEIDALRKFTEDQGKALLGIQNAIIPD